MKLRLKKFKVFSDHTGSLAPFYKKQSLNNFNIKRFFFVYGNKKYPRADHAHKKCNQILIPVSGKITVELTTRKKIKKKFKLNASKKNYLIVPKLNWLKLMFKEKNSILLTLCDYNYSKKEYIQQKKDFFKIK